MIMRQSGLRNYQVFLRPIRLWTAPGKSSMGLRAEGREEEKDTKLSQRYELTSPFLGERGSL